MKKETLLLSLLIILSTNIFCIETKSTVTITSFYTKPKSFTEPDTIILKTDEKGEYIEIIVNGTIIDFEIVSILDESQITKVSKIKDKTIIILTYQPEGMPMQRIQWKDVSGKFFEYLVQDYNSGIGESQSHIFEIN